MRVVSIMGLLSSSPIFPVPRRMPTGELPWYATFAGVSSLLSSDDDRWIAPLPPVVHHMRTVDALDICLRTLGGDATVLKNYSLWDRECHITCLDGQGCLSDVWLKFTPTETHVVSAFTFQWRCIDNYE